MDRDFLTTDKKLFEPVIWLSGEAYIPNLEPEGLVLSTLHQKAHTLVPQPSSQWSVGNELWHAQGPDLIYQSHSEQQIYHWQKKGQELHLIQELAYQNQAGCPRYHPAVGYLWVEEDETGFARIVLSTAGKATVVDEGHHHYRQLRWSDDGSSFAAIAWDNGELPWEARKLYWYQREPSGQFTGCEIASTHSKGLSCISQILMLSDKRLLVCARFQDAESLFLFDCNKQNWQRLCSSAGYFYTRAPWGMMESSLAYSTHRRSLFALRRKLGRSELVEFDLDADRCQIIKSLSNWTFLKNLSLSADGRQGYLEGASYQQSLSLIHLDLTAEIEPKILVKGSGSQTALQAKLSKPQFIQWHGHQGSRCQGFIYSPNHHVEKQALIVLLHGGPYQEVELTWPLKAHAFNPLGYAIAYFNVSGSSGQSWKSYSKLESGWGKQDAKDVLLGVSHLCREFPIDPERIILWGGAAGGYLVLKALSLAPELFAAGIVVYPYWKFSTLSQNSDSCYKSYIRRLVPECRNSAISKNSETFLSTEEIGQIKSPVAIFHGQKDEKIPWQDSQDLASILESSGNKPFTHFYPELGHSWTKKDTLLRYYQDVQKFLLSIADKGGYTR